MPLTRKVVRERKKKKKTSDKRAIVKHKQYMFQKRHITKWEGAQVEKWLQLANDVEIEDESRTDYAMRSEQEEGRRDGTDLTLLATYYRKAE